MELEKLAELNPWWKGKERIAEDENLIQLASKKYQWRPWLLDIDWKIGNVYSIRGPRQLGKTTTLKLIVKKLLFEQNKPPASVLYWSCEDIGTHSELVDLIQSYLTVVKPYNYSEHIILLDEITFVKEWSRAIKLLADRGYLKNVALIMTGSSTVDLKYGMDRLPGRTGQEGKDSILLPLTFKEFVNLVRPELGLPKMTLTNFDVEQLRIFDRELKDLFQIYLICGGFPLTINTFMEKRTIEPWLYDLYLRWVIGDLIKTGRQEKMAVQILRALLERQCGLVSWDGVAKEVEIRSHKTISGYVETLEELFVLSVSYFYDTEKSDVNFAKNKKIHFIDPFITNAICRLVRKSSNEACVVEDIIAANISAFLLRDLLPFGTPNPVHYSLQKKETDIVFIFKGETYGVEVKYQKNIGKEDWFSLSEFERGFLVTRNYYEVRREKRTHVALPVHAFLMLSDPNTY
ncbi:MAG: ATP-binding protein [Candidatus Micrarchaeota archaeon]